MIILEENFKWHLEAFASELFIYYFMFHRSPLLGSTWIYTLKEIQVSYWHFQTIKHTSSCLSCNLPCFTEKLAGYQKCHTAMLWPTAALNSHRCFAVFIMHHGRKHLVIKYVSPERYERRTRMG